MQETREGAGKGLRRAALAALLALVAATAYFVGSHYDEVRALVIPPEPVVEPFRYHPDPDEPARANPWLDGRPAAITDGTAGPIPIYVETARLWTFTQVYDAYVHSRIIEIAPREGAPLGFGPWEASRDELAVEASNEGLLTEWQDNYYIAHDWSAYGQAILMLAPGDSVTINGREMTVQGIFEYPKLSYDEEIRWITRQNVDEDIVVLQTCVPDSDRNRFAYGR